MQVRGRAGSARACGAAGPCRPAGSWSRSAYCGPQTSCSSVRWSTRRPGWRTSTSSRCHSVGVSRTAPARVDPAGRQVDAERADADDGARRRRRRAAQGGPQPGEQLVHPERLGHVVVGAGVQGGDLVRLAPAAGEHQIGHGGPARRPRITSTPSRSGRPRSSTTTSGGCWAARAQRRRPSAASVDLVAPGPQVDPSARRSCGSSSTTSTRVTSSMIAPEACAGPRGAAQGRPGGGGPVCSSHVCPGARARHRFRAAASASAARRSSAAGTHECLAALHRLGHGTAGPTTSCQRLGPADRVVPVLLQLVGALPRVRALTAGDAGHRAPHDAVGDGAPDAVADPELGLDQQVHQVVRQVVSAAGTAQGEGDAVVPGQRGDHRAPVGHRVYSTRTHPWSDGRSTGFPPWGG